MQANKLTMAIRMTAVVAVLGSAGQAQAFSFNAGDVDASIYGYARLNMSYDFDDDVAKSSTNSGDFTATGSGKDGHFGASANQSRIGIKLKNSNDVTINVEGDFLTGTFRLRHAYGSYKGILAGQTWSNYSSFVGSTPTIDFGGLIGGAGYQSRTPQFRYTTGPVSLSVEDPKGRVATVTPGATQRNSTPAFTARLKDKAGGLTYSTAALVMQNTYDTGITDDSTVGFGVFGAIGLEVTDTITIRSAINYIDGATAYLYRAGSVNAYEDSNGDLKNVSGVGGTIGSVFDLGQGRSVNVSYGITKLDKDDIIAAGTGDKTHQNAFISYQWTPVKNVMMGVEYAFYSHEKASGDTEEANRMMFAAQYAF